MEQTCNIAIARVGFRHRELHAKLTRKRSGGQRVQQVLVHVESGAIGAGQGTGGGKAQRQILNGVDPEEYDRLVHRSDLGRQPVVSRIDYLEDFHR